ncbi:MAG: Uma2 family endonuclease [Lachnospiraceae bacterium]|nr:Uma2 family endonuclease [Lachnospiraceae bacterium]
MDAIGKMEYYTIDDIYDLPEGQRAELIDGQIYMMATPGRIHQKFVHFLDWAIENYIQSKNGDCEVYPAPFAVFLNANKEIYVEPDISVICDKNKLTDEGCVGAPDWIIEIVSPSSRSMDYNKKLLKYGTAKVKEYWIVDPTKQRITVDNFKYGTVEEYTLTDRVKVGIYEDFEIDFSTINSKDSSSL